MRKIWRSPYSAFGKFSRFETDSGDETLLAADVYDDAALRNIAASGFNGIWIHALLHHLVTTPAFPELAVNGAAHLSFLRTVIERAKRHGVEVYLYMQPPRAISTENHAFWDNHRDVWGQEEPMNGGLETGEGDFAVRSLCTSTEKVRTYLADAAAQLATALPGLGGVILITASEYPAHCWTRRFDRFGQRTECPRCAQRTAAEVTSEVVRCIRDGIRRVSGSMLVAAWNWAWSFHIPAPCEAIIAGLPRDVVLMADFERGGFKDLPGRPHATIDEYSLGYAGPSEQFCASYELARHYGLEMMAKLQFGTTHELATVANLPVLGNLFEKARFFREHPMAGFMGCWNFGNMISANTAGFNYFLDPASPAERGAALAGFVASYFPGCDAAGVAAAWEAFAAALDCYPFDIPYLYFGPTNFALGLIPQPGPLSGRTIGRSWLDDPRGDTMDEALKGEFSLTEMIDCFRLLAARWRRAVDLLRQALSGAGGAHVAEELGNATVAGGCFESTRIFLELQHLRQHWSEAALPAYRTLIGAELENLREVLPEVERDTRLGYHSEAHAYLFTAAGLREKIAALELQL